MNEYSLEESAADGMAYDFGLEEMAVRTCAMEWVDNISNETDQVKRHKARVAWRMKWNWVIQQEASYWIHFLG